MKNLFIFVSFFFLSNLIFAQSDVIYTVQANHNNIAQQLDSIVVENESNGKLMVFKNLPQSDAYNINITKGLIEAAPSIVSQQNNTFYHQDNFAVVQNSRGNLALNYLGTTTEQIQVAIYNTMGIMEYSNTIQMLPSTSLKFGLASNTIHLVTIKTAKGKQTFKTIGSGAIANFSLHIMGGLQANLNTSGWVFPIKRVSTYKQEDDTLGIFNFVQGDRLNVMVYKGTMIASPIRKILAQSESLNFNLKAFEEVYTQSNMTTEIPLINTDSIDWSKYQIAYASNIVPVQKNSNGSMSVRPKLVKHVDGSVTSNFNSNLQLRKNGGTQYIALKNPYGVDVMFGAYDLPKDSSQAVLSPKQNAKATAVSAINAESTALTALILHPFFINSSSDVLNLLKTQLKEMPSFETYKSNVMTRLVEEFKNPAKECIDYSKVEGYSRVIVEYMMNTTHEDDRMKGSVETHFNEWDGTNNASYKIVNTGKRTINIYANKQSIADSIIVNSEPVMQAENGEESCDGIFLASDKLDYWSTVKGTFWGYVNGNMPDYIFKSETDTIRVDLNDANRLEVEVWGLGSFHKPWANFTSDEQLKFIDVVISAGINDFITPAFELFSGVKDAMQPIETGKFDFRYGKRKKALSELTKLLAIEYIKDPENLRTIYNAVKTKSYSDIIKSVPPFIVSEIYSDISKPQNQTKYLNLIYNAYKNIIGETTQSLDVRVFIKNAFNSSFQYLTVAKSTIDILQASVDLAGAFYYTFADGVYTKSTFTHDYKHISVNPSQLQMLPTEKQQINILEGSGNYTLINSNPNTITTQILPVTPADPKVKKIVDVTALENGKANILIKDNVSNSMISIPVVVQNQCYQNLTLSSQNVTVGISQTSTLKIATGSGRYTISQTSPLAATYQLNNDIITIYGRTTGKDFFVVKDELTEQIKTIIVNVVYFTGFNPSKGLVAYYPFNGNANDASGNGNNCTVNGATLTTDRFGNANKAYSFNGVDNKISGNVNSLLSSSEKTISVWLKQSGSGNSNPRIVAVGPNGIQYQYYGLILEGTNNPRRLWFYTNDIINNAFSSTETYANDWENIIVTFKNNKVQFYKNGQLDSETIVQGTLTTFSSALLQIGYSDNGLDWFNGKIDDIRIYNRALSSDEVIQLYNSEKPAPDISSGLVAYYPFNGNANDESGHGNNGTVNGAMLTTDRFGDVNKAYSFDGVNDYIQANLNLNLNVTSISTWVYFRGNSSNYDSPQITHCYNSEINQHLMQLEFGTDNSIYFNSNVNNALRSEINKVQVGQWYNIIGTYDGIQQKIYLNGLLIASNNNTGSISLTNTILNIGRQINPECCYFNGTIDDIRIYNRALSSDEVNTLYNSEKPTLKSGLIAYYPFNGNANDESGHGNNGKVNGATLTTDRFGNVNKAYSFDGISTSIDINKMFFNIGWQEYTLSGWFCSNDVNRSLQNIFNTIPHTGVDLDLNHTYNPQRLDYFVNSNPSIGNWDIFKGNGSNFNAFQSNQWYHWVFEKYGNDYKLFINGNLESSNTGTISPISYNCGVKIGQISLDNPNQHFFGKLDDYRIYNRALSTDEITQLYNSEKPASQTVRDVDGNEYHTVTIGTQTWMVENLKTTHYRDGSVIPNVIDNAAWSGLSTGACCDYNNDAAIGAKYGKLYNWYAVNDSRNIAPAGWHVPTDAEWKTLEVYVSSNLGNSTSVAKALAATTDWTNGGDIGTSMSLNNSTGFTALPGSYRYDNGAFNSFSGNDSAWWTTSIFDNTKSLQTYLYFGNSYLGRNNVDWRHGLSVRCIKD